MTKHKSPSTVAYDSSIHNTRDVDAMLSVTKTEIVPLVFGTGELTPGQIIDDMIGEGNVSKIELNLDKATF